LTADNKLAVTAAIEIKRPRDRGQTGASGYQMAHRAKIGCRARWCELPEEAGD
jgi:hypothetical protein